MESKRKSEGDNYISQNNIIKKTKIKELPINRLCSVFFYVSSTENFFWFISLLQISACSNNRISVHHLFLRMIANAWHLILNHNLSLGYNDPLKKVLLFIQKNFKATKDQSIDDLYGILNHQKETIVEKGIKYINENLPFDFLCPLFDDSDDYNWHKRMLNKNSGSIYSVYYNRIGFYITVDKNWKQYFMANYWALLNFTYVQLADFLKLKNRRIDNLVPILREEGGITKAILEKLTVDNSVKYYLNTQKLCYVFNSQYEIIFSSKGKIIKINNVFYRLYLGSDYFLVHALDMLNSNEICIDKAIICAYDNSPLYMLFYKKKCIDQVLEIKKNKVGTYEINVQGIWYTNKGFSVNENIPSPFIITKNIKSERKIVSDAKTVSASKENVKSNLIGRYVKLFPSHSVGIISSIKITTKGDTKFVVTTIDGRRIEIYDNPYIYKFLTPSQVKKIKLK